MAKVPSMLPGLLGVIVLFVAASCQSQDAPTIRESAASQVADQWPATMPTTIPTTMPTAETAAGEQPDRPVIPKVIAEAMEFSPREKNIISGVVDSSMTLAFDKAMPLVLSHVAKIPQVSNPNLESVSTRMLMKYPNDFRYLPVKMPLKVYFVEKLTPGENTAESPYWPADKPIYRLNCISTDVPDPQNHPAIVLLPFDPAGILGEPDKINGNVWAYNAPGKQVTAFGVFYKIFRSEDLNRNQSNFPVLIAWQIEGQALPQAGADIADWMLGPVGIFVAVIILFFFFLWRLGKHRQARRQENLELIQRKLKRNQYQPDESEIEQLEPALREAALQYLCEHPQELHDKTIPTKKPPENDAQEEIIEVDPELKKAAQQYMKDHP